ncbi:PIN domain-containing protein [Candidatus Micrarchaeota archaeon]|nr:PIN domain-containing protein [Candidatus Micrarchaeota archaeon]MBU2477384.1 PIN domain-containing protein [Candidatus Micrarchaeota archaeon]
MLLPDSCFIDSNIFLDAATERTTKKIHSFLEKVKFGEIKGYINPIVVSEVFHKLAITEIIRTMKISYSEAIALTKEEPEIIKKLKTFKAINEIISYQGIEILEINKETVIDAIKISKEKGLLFQDALIASTCKQNRIEDILTNDKDFERADFLNVIKIN